MNEKTDAKISFTTGKFQRRLQQNTFESISDNQIFISDTVVRSPTFSEKPKHELATEARRAGYPQKKDSAAKRR